MEQGQFSLIDLLVSPAGLFSEELPGNLFGLFQKNDAISEIRIVFLKLVVEFLSVQSIIYNLSRLSNSTLNPT